MASDKKKKDKKSKQKEKEEIKDISSNKILIRIFKHFGSNTSILKAQYEATERRDMYGNLVSVNTEHSHNEDTDFTMDDVYREMSIVLELKNLGVTEKLAILDRKIVRQEKIIRILTKYPELNAIQNLPDQSVKARDFKLLRTYIQRHDDNGAYFTIEKGRRVYSFESIDGFLVPIWHGVDTYTQYPDHIRKKKITIQEDQRMRQEMAQFLRDKKIGSILTWGMVFVGIILVANIIGGYKLATAYSEVDKQLHGQAFQCAEYTSRVNQQLTQVLENTVIKELLEKNADERAAEEAAQEVQEDNIQTLTPELVIT